MNEMTDFEKEIANCLDFEPPAALDRRITAEIRRQAWKNRMIHVLRMPSRIPLAAALAVIIGVGSLLYYNSEQKKANNVVKEYAETLLEVQGLAEDEYIDTEYCYM